MDEPPHIKPAWETAEWVPVTGTSEWLYLRLPYGQRWYGPFRADDLAKLITEMRPVVNRGLDAIHRKPK